LLGACSNEPALDVAALENAARTGDSQALSQLVSLLARNENGLNDKVYAMLVEIGKPAIPALLAQVGSQDRTLREYTLAALGTLQAKAAVPAVITALQDRSFSRRYIAAWALGQIEDPQAIPALLQALDDDNSDVRRYATRALIRFNRAAVAPLLGYLPKAPERGAAGAIRALGDIGDARSLDALLQAVDGPNRPEVYLALGKLKERRAEKALIAGLADDDWRNRMNAAMALGPLGGPAAAAALRPVLEDPVLVVREWAARSLEMVSGEHVRYRNGKGELVMPYAIYH
jgi:HEAT repeat protein